ncbi:MAG: imm11 family protein [Hyalangium sp.]|uniref:imm11 family protein n=1 Tax=Hyalangium sp. TaxID=2028555 RepID=UPI00389AAEE5
MPVRYFDLFDDVSIPERWELGDPVDQSGQEVGNPWMFRKGVPVHVDGRLKVPIDRQGKPLDFSLAGVGVTPVVHAKVATLLAKLAPDDVQFVPVDVEDRTDEFFILNVTRVVKCIDDKASAEVQYWKPEDGRSEKTGNYRAVHGLRIDPSKAGGAKVFRPWGWLVVLLVSDEIKGALERIGATGTKFKEV